VTENYNFNFFEKIYTPVKVIRMIEIELSGIMMAAIIGDNSALTANHMPAIL